MKKKIYLLFLILLFPVICFSQVKIVTIGFYGGVLIPTKFTNDYRDNYKVSPNIGAEFLYTVSPNIGIVADVTYNLLSIDYAQTWIDRNFYYIESTAGVRYNIIPTKNIFFLEGGLGAYILKAKFTESLQPGGYGNELHYYDWSSTDFGINGGVGIIFPIDNTFSITSKVKFHNVFTSNGEKNYFSITAGVNYSF